jgi:queuine tRNA-ribosyltransferase
VVLEVALGATFSFEVLATCGHARRGVLHTPHGDVDTPAFMPVGTRAAVKGVTPAQLAQTGSQIVLANTYHMMLRPGPEVVARLGGLHRFMGWNGVILTDSGGFQVFSLTDLRRIDEDGVAFRSHLDGQLFRLTPESSIEIQNQLGADIIMAFDECPALPGDAQSIAAATKRTVAWARRSRAAHRRGDQALYGIVQGGLDAGLRRACLEQLVDIGFDGYALGGLSVGEPPPEMHAFLDDFARALPADRPRYLMGVGTPRDLVVAVCAGVDQFDCVLPTRNGRNAFAFTRQGALRFRNSAHIDSGEPIEADCDCYACRHFTRGAIRHFFNCGEMLGPILLSLHNLRFYQRLMSEIRTQIEEGGFDRWAAGELARGQGVR